MSRLYRHRHTDGNSFYDDFHTAKLQLRENKLPESLNEQSSNIPTQLNAKADLERSPYGGKGASLESLASCVVVCVCNISGEGREVTPSIKIKKC